MSGVMDRDDAEEYTQALGQVVAGGWRQVALGKRLGVPKALGITTEEWVEDRLGGYLRLSLPDRREAVAELTEEGLSTRVIGEVLGLSKSAVAREQAVPNGTEEEPEASENLAPEADAVPNGTEQPEPAPEPKPKPKPESESWNEQADALLEVAANEGSEQAARDLRDIRDARVMLRFSRALTEVLSTIESRDNILDAITRFDRDQSEDLADRCHRMSDFIARMGAAAATQATPTLRRVQ